MCILYLRMIELLPETASMLNILYSLFTDLLSAYKQLKQETHFSVDFLRQAIEIVTILHNIIMLYCISNRLNSFRPVYRFNPLGIYS